MIRCRCNVFEDQQRVDWSLVATFLADVGADEMEPPHKSVGDTDFLWSCRVWDLLDSQHQMSLSSVHIFVLRETCCEHEQVLHGVCLEVEHFSCWLFAYELRLNCSWGETPISPKMKSSKPIYTKTFIDFFHSSQLSIVDHLLDCPGDCLHLTMHQLTRMIARFWIESRYENDTFIFFIDIV